MASNDVLPNRKQLLKQREREEALQYYYSGIGEGRTYIDVALKFKKNERTIMRWAKEDKWKEKIERWEQEAIKRAENDLINKVRDNYIRDMGDLDKLKKGAMMVFAKNLREGKIKASRISDLEKLLDIQLKIAKAMGILEDEKEEVNVTVNNQVGLTEEDKEYIDRLAESQNTMRGLSM